MPRRLPPLNPLRVFEAVARHRSFTKAAQELCVTQGAVSRQVQVLEDHLGITLLDRRTGGQPVPTHGAKSYAASLGRAFDGIVAATEGLVATHTQSVLVIRSYTPFLVRWLVPRLPAFVTLYPWIEVRLVSAPNHVDFGRDHVDVGIRYGRGRWTGLESHALFQDELTPVCAPEMHAALVRSAGGASPGPADLAGRTLLQTHVRKPDWPAWFAAAGLEGVPASSRKISFEDLSVAYECAVAGMGFVLAQRAYVRDELASGKLVAPFDTVLRQNLGYHLVYPHVRADIPKVATFRDWLLSMPSAVHAG